MASMTSAGAKKEEHRVIGIFSYGSNNEHQLRARVNSPKLRGYPAHLDDYIRIFGFDGPKEGNSWGGGSVASIAPQKGGRVYGRYYLMTPKEVETLDIFEGVKEGVYLKEAVLVHAYVQGVEDGDGDAPRSAMASPSPDEGVAVACSAVAYVMSPRFVSVFEQPSPAYLTAVHHTLCQSFRNLRGEPIEICDYTCTKRSEWVHPGHLLSLPLKAFLVEVGLMEQPPWKLPMMLNPIISRLNAAEIFTTEELYKAAVDVSLLVRLASAAAEPQASEGKEKGVAAPQESSRKEGDSMIVTASLRSLVRMTPIPAITQQTVGIITRLGVPRDRLWKQLS